MLGCRQRSRAGLQRRLAAIIGQLPGYVLLAPYSLNQAQLVAQVIRSSNNNNITSSAV
jgi:hypothetical protein